MPISHVVWTVSKAPVEISQGVRPSEKMLENRIPSKDFIIDGKPAFEVLKADYHRGFIHDLEKSGYFVPVEWERTITEDKAVQEVGMFGNQNAVCRPMTLIWRTTVERLKAIML